MSLKCNVCETPFAEPLYQSAQKVSITTMNKFIDGATSVYYCDFCGHLQTNELPDLATFYAQEYEINLSSEDDDQLYKVIDGKPVFRAAFQAEVFLAKVADRLAPHSKILDYGCAKASTLKKILVQRPDLKPYLFDVTDKYIPFWKGLPNDPQWATFEPVPQWRGMMDAIVSFYALEHIADLRGTLKALSWLLKTGGLLYFIIPNVYTNIADFVVADHVNHFSKSSLDYLLQAAGFTDIEVDAAVHDGAYVVCAVLTEGKGCPPRPSLVSIDLRGQAERAADFWREIADKVDGYCQSIPDGQDIAIYGAGFYGNFIASTLKNRQKLRYFVDQNPHLKGKDLHGVPVVSPLELPASVHHLIVGLNPLTARQSIAAITDWQDRNLELFFLPVTTTPRASGTETSNTA